MKRFIEGENRSQSTLFPERFDDYITEDNAVRVVEAFVNKLDLKQLEVVPRCIQHQHCLQIYSLSIQKLDIEHMHEEKLMFA